MEDKSYKFPNNNLLMKNSEINEVNYDIEKKKI